MRPMTCLWCCSYVRMQVCTYLQYPIRVLKMKNNKNVAQVWNVYPEPDTSSFLPAFLLLSSFASFLSVLFPLMLTFELLKIYMASESLTEIADYTGKGYYILSSDYGVCRKGENHVPLRFYCRSIVVGLPRSISKGTCTVRWNDWVF